MLSFWQWAFWVSGSPCRVTVRCEAFLRNGDVQAYYTVTLIVLASVGIVNIVTGLMGLTD